MQILIQELTGLKIKWLISHSIFVSKIFPNALLKGYLGINADLRVNKFLVPSKLEKNLI